MRYDLGSLETTSTMALGEYQAFAPWQETGCARKLKRVVIDPGK
jgi:hypothetical protein